MKPTNNQLVTRRLALAVVLCMTLSAVCLRAQENPAPAGASEGEKMERQMWADFKTKEWKAVESKIAEGFQSIHPDGARDRAGEISLVEHLNLGEFTLSNFKTTVNGDNIVVTYTIAVQETIDQKRLGAKPTSAPECVKKRNARLAMDLPRQPQSDSVEIVALPRLHGDEINF